MGKRLLWPAAATSVEGVPQPGFIHGSTAREAPLGASPVPVANTSCVLSGDQSGCVALRPPRGRLAMKLPVARSTDHIAPFQAATTVPSSGEMVAKPWPPVLAMVVTSGVGGGAGVTSVT